MKFCVSWCSVVLRNTEPIMKFGETLLLSSTTGTRFPYNMIQCSAVIVLHTIIIKRRNNKLFYKLRVRFFLNQTYTVYTNVAQKETYKIYIIIKSVRDERCLQQQSACCYTFSANVIEIRPKKLYNIRKKIYRLRIFVTFYSSPIPLTYALWVYNGNLFPAPSRVIARRYYPTTHTFAHSLAGVNFRWFSYHFSSYNRQRRRRRVEIIFKTAIKVNSYGYTHTRSWEKKIIWFVYY